jgi:5'-3' exonuclease
MTNNSGVPTTVIFGVLRAIHGFISRNKIDQTLICWDGGSAYRKKVYKYYKENRQEGYKEDKFKEYIAELHACREYFDKMGLIQAQCKGIEADDTIGWYTARYHEKGMRPVIFADDKDFYQLSKYNPLYYRPTKMELITREETGERLKYPPWLLPRVVAFTGEKKDNIPGTADTVDNICQKIGLGEAKAVAILKNPKGGWYTVREAIDQISPKNRFYRPVKANQKQILMSYKLSRIRTKPELYEDWELKFFKEIDKKMANPPTVKRGIINSIGEFLEFKSINLAQTLVQIGVKIK